jgi:hypothetical protein
MTAARGRASSSTTATRSQPRLRRHLPQRRHRHRANTDQGAERERTRRALGRQRPQRVPRPASDLRSPSARARPPRVHPPLQRAASTQSARPTPAGSRQRNRTRGQSGPSSAAGQAARPPRWPPPRIRSRGVTIEFVHTTPEPSTPRSSSDHKSRSEHAWRPGGIGHSTWPHPSNRIIGTHSFANSIPRPNQRNRTA